MSDKVECIVVGAGVVGLAIARALALQGREVVVLEAEGAIGTGVSARNSEVIHAGIYYPAGSLKTGLCVAGRRLLYPYCSSHGVAHKQVGKLIVASDEDEIAVLEQLRAAAEANGLDREDRLQWLDGAAARKLEPSLKCVAALLSPATGIIDAHGLMLAYRGDLEDRGGVVALHARLVGAERTTGGFRTRIVSEGAETELDCTILINSAGLGAQAVAASIAGLPAPAIPTLYTVKGNYFTIGGRPAFTRLIYPVPVKHGLGVHVTLDLAGQMRFGPDTEAVDRLDYTVDPRRADVFYEAIRRYWPALPDGALTPAYAGIRPKLQGPNDGFRDFVIQDGAHHGLPGLVNLYGIESPGLTASFAIADMVAGMVAR